MSGLHTHRHLHAARAAAAALAVGAVTAFAVVVPTSAAYAAPPGTAATTTASPTRPTVPTDARKQTAKKPTSPGNRGSALPTPEEIQAIAVPLDRELAGAVRMLKAAGIDQMALQAAQVILASNGQLSAESLNKAVMSVYNGIGTSRSGYVGSPGRRPVPGLPTVTTATNTRAPPRTSGRGPVTAAICSRRCTRCRASVSRRPRSSWRCWPSSSASNPPGGRR